MALNADIIIPANAWTELTNADADTVRLQVISKVRILRILGTSGAAPTDVIGDSIAEEDRQLVVDLAEDYGDGTTRLWAYSGGVPAKLYVRHEDV